VRPDSLRSCPCSLVSTSFLRVCTIAPLMATATYAFQGTLAKRLKRELEKQFPAFKNHTQVRRDINYPSCQRLESIYAEASRPGLRRSSTYERIDPLRYSCRYVLCAEPGHSL
jgi:hypothetical protein